MPATELTRRRMIPSQGRGVAQPGSAPAWGAGRTAVNQDSGFLLSGFRLADWRQGMQVRAR